MYPQTSLQQALPYHIQLIQSSVIMPVAVVSNAWVSWLIPVVLFGGLATLIVSMISIQLGKKWAWGLILLPMSWCSCRHLCSDGWGDCMGSGDDCFGLFTVILSGVMIYLLLNNASFSLPDGGGAGGVDWVQFRIRVCLLLATICIGLGCWTRMPLVVVVLMLYWLMRRALSEGVPLRVMPLFQPLALLWLINWDALIITHHDTDHRGGLPRHCSVGRGPYQ